MDWVSLLLARRGDAQFRSSPGQRPQFSDRTESSRAPRALIVCPTKRGDGPSLSCQSRSPACARPRSSDHRGGQAQDKCASARSQPFAPCLRPPQIYRSGAGARLSWTIVSRRSAGSRHIPSSCFPRLLFDREPLGGASAGLELRPDTGVSRLEQRRRGRAGGPATRISDHEVGNCSAPTIGSAGQKDEVGVPAQQSFAQERPRALQNLRRAAFAFGRVEPPEPDNFAAAELDIETLVDADGLNAPRGPPASRKAGRGENHGQERGDAAESPNASRSMRGCGARSGDSC